MASILKVDTLQKPDGSTPTAADLGIDVAGSVVQVVTSSNTTPVSNTSNDFIATGWNFSITPKHSTSKVKVDVNIYGAASKASYVSFQIFRSINGGAYTLVSPISTEGSYNTGDSFLTTAYIPSDTHHEHTQFVLSGTFMDNPQTTDTVTYAVHMARRLNSGNAYMNRADSYGTGDHHSHGVSTASLTEIAQ